MITPLHPKLSISLYTDGLLYRKGRNSRVVRWEEILAIERQFKVYRGKKKISHVRPAYICRVSQKPDLVLSAAITNVTEVDLSIERELTRRLLPTFQSNYQTGKPVIFSQLTLTQHYLENSTREMNWRQVSRIEVGPEQLIVESMKDGLETLTVSLTNVLNVCVLEALLKDIQAEKRFALSLTAQAETRDASMMNMKLSDRPGWRRQSRKTTWISTLALSLVVIPGLGLQMWSMNDALHFQQLDALPSQTFQITALPIISFKQHKQALQRFWQH
jgi:hypothetical protein